MRAHMNLTERRENDMEGAKGKRGRKVEGKRGRESTILREMGMTT